MVYPLLIQEFVITEDLCDFNQHFNHRLYLDYCEKARYEYTQLCSSFTVEELMKIDIAFFIVEMNIKYKKEAFLHDKIVLETVPDKISPVYGYKHVFKRNNIIIAECYAKGVIMNFSNKKILSLKNFNSLFDKYNKF